MMLTLPLLLLLTDIGPPPPECTRDRECELTTFVGCCGACCPGVRAAPKGKSVLRHPSPLAGRGRHLRSPPT
jgi:hypothetical protein